MIQIPKVNGTVKWFDDEKGYGFIVHNGVEHFIHFSNINMKGRKTLIKDQQVRFVPSTSDKGKPIALDVEVIHNA